MNFSNKPSANVFIFYACIRNNHIYKKGVNEMQNSNLEVNLGPIIKYNRK